MEEIIIHALVVKRLNNLLDVLLYQGYFVEEENAIAYLKNIRNFIEFIPTQRHRPTINPKYGSWYCEYKPNRRTSWFVTFDKKGHRYIVRNLINNHTKEYPAFIKGL